MISLFYASFRLKNLTPIKDMTLDVLSLVLSSIAFGGLLYGFSSVGDLGWNHYLVYVPITVGTITLFLFVRRQFTLRELMLDFRIYRFLMFALSSVISFFVLASLFLCLFLFPLSFLLF